MWTFFDQTWQSLRIALEIGLLAFLIYSILLFLRGTRAAPVLAGITIVALLLSVLTRVLGLEVIDWLMIKMWTILAVAVVIIFQPEIRRALAEIGSQSHMRAAFRSEREIVDMLLESVFFLADRRIGALIVIQRNIGLRPVVETGTTINAPLTQELLTTFFYPNTPLHDGGVVIKDGRVLAAGCILPLTQDPDMAKNLGTRHRAGVGITEETDAVAIIVSEETGAVSIAHKGRMLRGLNRQRLERHLTNLLLKDRQPETGKTLETRINQVKAMFVGPFDESDDDNT